MRILLTGGVGYIGSHTAVALIAAGHEIVCLDNLANNRADVMDRLEAITQLDRRPSMPMAASSHDHSQAQ